MGTYGDAVGVLLSDALGLCFPLLELVLWESVLADHPNLAVRLRAERRILTVLELAPPGCDRSVVGGRLDTVWFAGLLACGSGGDTRCLVGRLMSDEGGYRCEGSRSVTWRAKVGQIYD